MTRGSRVTAALAYLGGRTLRNRIVGWLAKLKTARYAIAFVLGLIYFAFFIGGALLDRGEGAYALFTAAPWALPLAALALSVWAVWWWVFGKHHKALSLTPAEVDLLVTAPIPRRALVTYKLARAQVGVAFFALWMSLFIQTGLGWGMRFAGLWVAAAVIHLHQVAAALVRTAALEQGRVGARRQALPILLVGAVVTIVAVAVGGSLSALVATLGMREFGAAAALLADALSEPLPHAALWPVRLVLAPLFAGSAGEWAVAMLPALAVLSVHYVWILRTDAAFEEGAAEAGRERAKLVSAMRKGGLFRASLAQKKKAGPAAFRLRPAGRPWVAILWKNLTMYRRAGDPKMLLFLAIPVVMIAVFAGEGDAPLRTVLGGMMLGIAGLATFFGALAVRNDMRTDLQKAELLRTYPLDGGTLVAAEIAASAGIVSVAQLGLAGVGWLLLRPSVIETAPSPGELGVILAVAAFAPLATTLLVVAQNGLAILFPAWAPLGQERPGGIDALGMMVVNALLTALISVVGAFPPLLAAGVVGGATYAVAGATAGLAAGAVVGWIVAAAEIHLLIAVLGDRWDRLDVVEAGLIR